MRLGENDAEGRKKLAGYMVRAPMSLEKMRYDAKRPVGGKHVHVRVERTPTARPSAFLD